MVSLVVTAGAIAAGAAAAYNFVVVPLAGTFAGQFEDFAAYAGAAHAVAAGTSPYAGFDASTIVMSGFDYPPFTAVLLRPLAFLSTRWQDITWLWLSLAALVGGAVISARALLPHTWPRARIGVIAAVTFPPAAYNLWHGQMNTIVFLLLAMALSDYLSGHRTRCGVILGLAASIKLAPILLLLVLVRRGWWRAAGAGVATCAVALAVGVAALGWPVTWQYISTVLPVLNRDNGWIYNQTWNGVFSRLAGHAVLFPATSLAWLHVLVLSVSLVTVAAALVVVRSGPRSRAARGAEFGCGIIAMVLVGSIAWYPVYVHLLIAVAAALGLAHEAGPHRRALVGWSLACVVGTGVIGATVIAALTREGINAISSGPLWWAFLQACSLPALLAAGLLAALIVALRRGVVISPSAAPAP